MTYRAGESGESHDKDACADCRFEFVSQDAGQEQKHHHDHAVSYIEISVFAVGVGADCAGKNVACEGDAHRFLGGEP